MEQEKFDEFKLKILKHVTEEWMEHKEYQPHLFFINENGGRKAVPLPLEGFNSPESKEILVDLMVDMLSLVKAKMCCVTTEGWMISSKEGEELKNEDGEYIRPSLHPDKQEVLTFMFESLNNNGEMMTLLNTNGKLSPHDPGKSLDGDDVAQVGGMFTGLLKKSKEKW